MILECLLTAGLLIPPCNPAPLPRTHDLDRPDLTVEEAVPQLWFDLAVCESGMNGEPRWAYDGSSGFDGGLQFHPDTWSWLAPDGFPDYAYEASPAQQIEVAEITLDLQGWGAWPACSEKLEYR